jgi:glycosyltransferase involved in cell wall biosynthesis
VPTGEIRKAPGPTALFVARWDRRKRPERFFELARRLPEVRFVAVGRGQDPAYEAMLRERFGGLPNLELAGFVDQFRDDRLSRLYREAWVLVNTASREGLPTTFLEALAHRCALLSAVNPLGVAERFGRCVTDGDFEAGLRALLADGTWRERGAAGRRWVEERFAEEVVMSRHLELYRSLLDTPRAMAA